MNQLNLGQMREQLLQVFRDSKKITSKDINGDIEDDVRFYFDYLNGMFNIEFLTNGKYQVLVDRSYWSDDDLEKIESEAFDAITDYLIEGEFESYIYDYLVEKSRQVTLSESESDLVLAIARKQMDVKKIK